VKEQSTRGPVLLQLNAVPVPGGILLDRGSNGTKEGEKRAWNVNARERRRVTQRKRKKTKAHRELKVEKEGKKFKKLPLRVRGGKPRQSRGRPGAIQTKASTGGAPQSTYGKSVRRTG